MRTGSSRHGPARRRLVVARARAALGHPDVAQEDVHPVDVEVHARAADRGQDAAPVRVAAVEGGLDERRLRHGARDAVGVGLAARAPSTRTSAMRVAPSPSRTIMSAMLARRLA